MNEEPSEKKIQQHIFIRSLIYFLIMLFFSLSIIWGFSHISRSRVIGEYELKAMTQLEYEKNVIQNHFLSVRSDLLFLPRLNEMIRYREEHSEELRQSIEKEFLEFNRFKDVYDQIRYLDQTGMEKVRINFVSGEPAIVKREELQDKGDRYYFLDSVSRPEGEVYISPFDLNVENGQVELPLKPMIRFATALYDSRKQIKGVVLLNFKGEAIIDDLREAVESFPGDFYLLNTKGYWLFSIDGEDEWGFMYKDKQNFTMAQRHPELWQKISSSVRNQFFYDDALYTSLLVTPYPDVNDYNQERSWILINRISFDEMGVSRRDLIPYQPYVIILIAVICLVIAALLGKTVTHKNLYREALSKSAFYDALTGLPNRKYLEERAQQVLEQSRRYSRKFAIIFIDLDGFKSVNDSLGHEAGDELLKQVGERMTRCVRSVDTVARFGGDEFIVLLSQIEKEDDCSLIARKILDTLSSDFTLALGRVQIGASLGVALGHPESAENFEGMIQRADAAMYDVKSAGKNDYKIV